MATAVIFLSGCGGASRPEIISASGISPKLEAHRAGSANLVDEFIEAADVARSASGQKGSVGAQREFIEAGYALISVQCSKYLSSKADNQRRVNVWRDTFAPVTAALTGIISLTNKGEMVDSDVLTALSLGTSATSAGFKIYEERYLFSARNINSVRRLVLEAVLDNYREAAKIKDDKLNFRQAALIVIENQHVCSPENISELVSQAIDAGKIASSRDGGTPATPPVANGTPTPSVTPSTTPPQGIERVTTKAI